MTPTCLTNYDLPYGAVIAMQGPRPPMSFRSVAPYVAPLVFRQTDLRSANHFHQYARSLCLLPRQRRQADRDFYRNLRTCGVSPLWAGGWFVKARLTKTLRGRPLPPAGDWQRLAAAYRANQGGTPSPTPGAA